MVKLNQDGFKQKTHLIARKNAQSIGLLGILGQIVGEKEVI